MIVARNERNDRGRSRTAPLLSWWGHSEKALRLGAGWLFVLDAELRSLGVGEVAGHASAEETHRLVVIGLPQPGRAIIACCGDVLAIGGDGYRLHSGSVADEAPH